MKIQNILVAVDFSSHSEAALELAQGLIEAGGGQLHLVHVFPEALALAPPYGPALPADFGMQVERAAVDHFQAWQEEFCPGDESVMAHVCRGDPSKQIVETAERLGIDLIVMGTRGATGLDHVLMGSVAERTLRSAHCPVLTVKGAE